MRHQKDNISTWTSIRDRQYDGGHAYAQHASYHTKLCRFFFVVVAVEMGVMFDFMENNVNCQYS